MMNKRLFTLFILLVSSVGWELTIKENIVNGKARKTTFASEVIHASSSFGMDMGPWSAFAATDKPDTYPEYGDYPTAWTPQTADEGMATLTLGVEEPIYVRTIEVYETLHPGAVCEIRLRDFRTGEWKVVYAAQARPAVQKARILKVKIPLTDYTADAVCLILDTGEVPGWNQIDAVALKGYGQ